MGFYLKGLVLVALAGGVAALVTEIDDEVKWGVVTVVVIVAAVLLVLAGLLKRIATTYTITNRRLHIRQGIVARHVQQARLERVQNVSTSQSVLERILQVGTVDFDTAAAGTEEADFAFDGVSQPEKVMAAVDQAQREHAEELAKPPGTPPGDQL